MVAAKGVESWLHSPVHSPTSHPWVSVQMTYVGFAGHDRLLHWWPELMSACFLSCDMVNFSYITWEVESAAGC